MLPWPWSDFREGKRILCRVIGPPRKIKDFSRGSAPNNGTLPALDFQMGDWEKKARATFVVQRASGFALTRLTD
jgi:hypothetical protein